MFHCPISLAKAEPGFNQNSFPRRIQIMWKLWFHKVLLKIW